MNLFKRLLGGWAGDKSGQSATKMVSINSIFGGLYGERYSTSNLCDYASYLKAGSGKIWAAFKCCQLCANVLISTPTVIVKKGGSDDDRVKLPDLEKLLAVPNPYDTWGDMLMKFVFHLKLCGNAFWAKGEPNLNNNKPSSLWSLNPRRIVMNVDSAGKLGGYTYTTEAGLQIPFDVNEVMHFKWSHPNNDWWGLGEIEPGEPMFQDALNRDKWTNQFWKNGAAPSGVILFEDGYDDLEAWKLKKAEWDKNYSGSDKAGKTAWIGGKAKYQQLGLTAQEMQNIEGSRWSVEQIAMIHGVPASVLGLKDASNFATARVDDLRFRRYTVKPLAQTLADTLNSDLVTGFNPGVEFRFQLTGLDDVSVATDIYLPLFQAGVLSVNELRQIAGLKPKDDPLFDQHFISAGLVPLDLSGMQDQGQIDAAADDVQQRAIRKLLDAAVN